MSLSWSCHEGSGFSSIKSSSLPYSSWRYEPRILLPIILAFCWIHCVLQFWKDPRLFHYIKCLLLFLLFIIKPPDHLNSSVVISFPCLFCYVVGLKFACYSFICSSPSNLWHTWGWDITSHYSTGCMLNFSLNSWCYLSGYCWSLLKKPF